MERCQLIRGEELKVIYCECYEYQENVLSFYHATSYFEIQ